MKFIKKISSTRPKGEINEPKEEETDDKQGG